MTNTELIRQEIERRIGAMYNFSAGYSALNVCRELLDFIDSLPKESAIKVYRVENEKQQKGLWRKFDGTWEPLFDMLTDGQCKDMPMEDSPIYREGGKQWFASAPSKETLQKWFSKKDLEELTNKGFTISEFTVYEYKQLTEFEYIFTRDSIVARNYLKVEDIYPPKNELEEEVKKYINDNWEGGHPNEKTPLYLYDFSDKDLLDAARHFAKWGAEHRDRFLNWSRDLIKKGIEKPEEALNILKRIDTLVNDNSLWAEHLKK